MEDLLRDESNIGVSHIIIELKRLREGQVFDHTKAALDKGSTCNGAVDGLNHLSSSN